MTSSQTLTSFPCGSARSLLWTPRTALVLRCASGRDPGHASAHLDRRDGRVLPVCHPYRSAVRPADEPAVCRWVAACPRWPHPAGAIDHLIEARVGTVYVSTVEVEGPSGATLVDARPSDALNLVALVPAPILVARDLLADVEAKLEGDSPEAILLRRVMEAEQTTIQRQPSDP